MPIFYLETGSIANLEISRSLLVSGSLTVSGAVNFTQGTNILTASSTAPTTPTNNTLWYDLDDGRTYIRLDDGTSTQWVLQSDPTIDVNLALQTLQEVTDLGSSTNNQVTITNSTASTGRTSGALIVSGGLGVSGSIHAAAFIGDGSGLTGVTATYTETSDLEDIIARGNTTSGSIVVTSTTNATSTTTGVIRAAGGISSEKDIWADNIFAVNRISASRVTGSFFGDGSGITGIAGTDTFKTISVAGQTSVVADSQTDTLTLSEGSGIQITTNATSDTLTFTYTGATGGNAFATFSVATQNNVIADTQFDTLTLVAGNNITITTDSATDTITINSSAAAGGNSFATFSVAGQNNVIADQSFDTVTFAQGSGIQITTDQTTDTLTFTYTGATGGNAFATFSVSGQNNVVADTQFDTLTLTAGSGIEITTNDTTDTITIAATGGGGGSGNVNSNRAAITLYDPTNAEDATIFFTSASLTIRQVEAVLRGSGGQSVTITLRHDTDRSAAGSLIVNAQAITSITTGTNVTLSTGTTVGADSFVWLETTAKAGTVNELFVQLFY